MVRLVNISEIPVKSDSYLSESYRIGKEINEVHSRDNLKARHLQSGEKRAVQIIPKSLISSQAAQDQLLTEISVLSSLDHPNLIKLYEYYQDSLNYYMVSERALGSNLLSPIVGHISESLCASYMQQIFSVLSYLKSFQVLHRNIKPESFIFSSKANTGNFKLVNFQMCVMANNNLATGRIGTPYYIAPEVLSGSYSCTCDMWSAGVIMYLLLGGTPPFNGRTQDAILRAVSIGTFDFNSEIWGAISDPAKELISRLLEKNPQVRITPDEALSHSWLGNTNNAPPSKEISSLYVTNLSSFKSKEKSKRAIVRYMASGFTKKAEREELLAMFRSLDVNQNGLLSKQELKVGFTKLFGNRLKNVDSELDKIIAEVDLDNSGEISYNEFVVAAMGKQKLMDRQRLEEVFKSIDVNNSGTIDIAELRMMLSKFVNDETTLQEMVKECDVNGDGLIDIHEFIKLMLKA